MSDRVKRVSIAGTSTFSAVRKPVVRYRPAVSGTAMVKSGRNRCRLLLAEVTGSACRSRRRSSRKATVNQKQQTVSDSASPKMMIRQAAASEQSFASHSISSIPPIRVSCSTICATLGGVARRRAIKYPFRQLDTPMNGNAIPLTASAACARLSPMRRDKGAAKPYSAPADTIPIHKLNPMDSRSTRKAVSGSERANASAAIRVTAVVSPAAANAVPSTYTENTSWYSPIPSAPTRLEMKIRKTIPNERSSKEEMVITAVFFTNVRRFIWRTLSLTTILDCIE